MGTQEMHLKAGDVLFFTDAITQKAIGMVEEAVSNDKPFFLYLALNTPHYHMVTFICYEVWL